MKNFTKTITILTVTLCLSSTSVYAHSGRTDSSGGHYDKSTGRYHYHGGGSSSSSYSGSSSSSDKDYSYSLVTDEKLDNLREDIVVRSNEASGLLEAIDYLDNRYQELVTRYDIVKNRGVKINKVPYKDFSYEEFLLEYEIIDSSFYEVLLMRYNTLTDSVNKAKPSIMSYEQQLNEYEEYITDVENIIFIYDENLKSIKNLELEYLKLKNNFKNVYNIDIPDYIVDYSKDNNNIISELEGLINKYGIIFNERKEQIIQTEEIGVYFNGTKVNVGAYINKSVVYIELRPLMELLGYEVKWNDKSGKIEIPISQGTMKLSKGSNKVEYNGYIFEMPGKVEIKNGKTYVPINLFDENIFYDKIHNVILIETFK